jgi:hypothetical protein
MKILYLPANPKYRAFIERCIEFIEQVYKDEVLADLNFVALSSADKKDMEEKEKLEKVLKLRIGMLSHYDPEARLAIVDEPYNGVALFVFWATVEEVSHHVFLTWEPYHREQVITALLNDIPRLRMVAKRAKQEEVEQVSRLIEELFVKYVIDNYFYKLKDKPVFKPWIRGNFRYVLEWHHSEYFWDKIKRRQITIEQEVAEIIFDEVIVRRNPLPNFREVVHTSFTKVIKKFPVEVYNSNPSRYKVLYKRRNIQRIRL